MEWGIKQGSKLKELRIKKGFGQAYVANKLSVNITSISNWETGKNKPKPKHLHDMAFLYNVPIEEITEPETSGAINSSIAAVSSSIGTYKFSSEGITFEPQFDKTTSEIVAFMSMLTGKSEFEITAEAVKHYALMFNWSDCIKQKYFDETDQM